MDYLEILFSSESPAGETVYQTVARERAEMAAENATRAALRCPRCMGEGRLSQFMHHKGGECFLCGGSGVFSGYKG